MSTDPKVAELLAPMRDRAVGHRRSQIQGRSRKDPLADDRSIDVAGRSVPRGVCAPTQRWPSRPDLP